MDAVVHGSPLLGLILARESHRNVRARRTDRDSDKEGRANICVHEVAKL
jgi:hypothetical protein